MLVKAGVLAGVHFEAADLSHLLHPSNDEARHGRAFKGLLDRYFG